ncbi:hypothetical protein COCNU_03G016680 [Cocos nucifera]|uniref:Uncharacterized protein n=1 Tax=Cocos nucifera TaxID=13894 RepID=A0A8K0MZK0_COCNU|nr:hypothetical protein COCNU_03G016680 [Cocos nucifera]
MIGMLDTEEVSSLNNDSYTLIMRMIGENGSQLTCINFDFSIGFMSQVANN